MKENLIFLQYTVIGQVCILNNKTYLKNLQKKEMNDLFDKFI